MPLAENKDMVRALAADRADEPFREGFCHGLWAAVSTSRIRMRSPASAPTR
jgi:hypothetical protein